MAIIVETVVIEKEANSDPLDLSFGTTLASSMGIVVFALIDINSSNVSISELTKLATGTTHLSGGSLTCHYVNSGADTVSTLTLNTSADGLVVALLISDHDQTNMIEAFNAGSAPITPNQLTRSLTTLSDNSLVVHALSVDGNRGVEYRGNGALLFEGTGESIVAASGAIAYYLQQNAGTYPEQSVSLTTQDGGGAITISIRDKNPSDPTLPVFPINQALQKESRGSFTDLEVVFPEIFISANGEARNPDLIADGTTSDSRTLTSIAHGYTDNQNVVCISKTIPQLTVGAFYRVNVIDEDNFQLFSTPAGKNFVTLTSTAGHQVFRHINIASDIGFNLIGFTKSRGGPHSWVTGGGAFTSRDLSSENIVLNLSNANDNEAKTIAEKGIIAVFTSPNAWRAFVVGGNNENFSTSVDFNVYINLNSGTHFDEFGSFDPTQVDGIYLGVRTPSEGASPNLNYNSVSLLREATIIGGTPTKRVSARSISNLYPNLFGFFDGNYFSVGGQIKIGDGSTRTYYQDPEIGSGTFLPTNQIDDSRVQTLPGTFSFKFECSAFDEIEATKPVVCEVYEESGVEPFYYNFNGKTVTATFSCVLASWQTSNNRTFRGCEKVIHNGATLNSPTFSDSLSATGAINWDSNTNITNPSFDKNNYHIEIENAGSYSFIGHSYENAQIADLYISATSGTVTINVSGGDTPTYVSEGATVVIVAGALLEFTDLKPGSEVRVYEGTNSSTAIEIGGVESSGTSFSMTQSSVGLQGYVIIHALGYLNIKLPLVFSSNDVSIPIQQQTDRQYQNV